MNWQDAIPEELDSEGQKNVEATIRTSLDHGLNHIETARGYGTSEYQLGRFLPNLDRDSFILQTKVEPNADSRVFLKDFELSMELLQMDRVDLLGVHGINNQEQLDWCTKPGGCFEVIEKLKEDGRIGHVGFSTHGDSELILKAINTNFFSYVNLHWYYIYQRNVGCIRRASELDMGVFIISPNDKGGMLYKPSEKLKGLCSPLEPMVFNDLYCLYNEDVHTISLGAAQPSDFDVHLKAVSEFELHRDKVNEITARLDKTMEDLLGQEFRENWYESIPPWSGCPGETNIRVIVWLWMLAKAYDMKDYGKMRYNLIGNGGHWFPGLQPASEKMSDMKHFLSETQFGEKIYEILNEAVEMFHGEEIKRLSQS